MPSPHFSLASIDSNITMNNTARNKLAHRAVVLYEFRETNVQAVTESDTASVEIAPWCYGDQSSHTHS